MMIEMETRGWGSEFKRSCGGKELSHKNYTATIAFNMTKSCGLSIKNSLGFIRALLWLQMFPGFHLRFMPGKRFRHVSSSVGRGSTLSSNICTNTNIRFLPCVKSCKKSLY